MEADQDPRWLALSQERRSQLLEKYRNINVDYIDWWECVQADLIDEMSKVGFDISNTYFSGFWSQGDGASFTGRVTDWLKFAVWLGYSTSLGKMLEDGGTTLSVVTQGRYSHSGTMELSWSDPINPYDEDELMERLTWDAATEHGLFIDNHEREILAKLRERADQYYRDLEQEHEYLTSDAQVIEYILDHVDLEEEMTEPH